MKILLLGQVPAHYYSLKSSKSTFAPFQAHHFWQQALEDLGHQVVAVDYTKNILLPQTLVNQSSLALNHHLPRLHSAYRRLKSTHPTWFLDNHLRSRQLSDLISSFRPDVLIVSGGISELTRTPFQTAKSLGTRLFLLHGVHPNQLSTRIEKSCLTLFDWVITNDPTHANAWRQLGAPRAVALPYTAIDPKLHHRPKLTPSQLRQLDTDLLFVGTLFPDRQQLLTKLTKHHLKIYGHLPTGVRLLPALKPFFHGEIWGKAMVRAISTAKITLNLVPSHMPVGGNMRTFEIPGSYGFQLANRCPANWFTPDKEIVIFDNLSQLANKIDHFLNHPSDRQKIRKAGYHRAHADHTYTKRFKHLLSL